MVVKNIRKCPASTMGQRIPECQTDIKQSELKSFLNRIQYLKIISMSLCNSSPQKEFLNYNLYFVRFFKKIHFKIAV